jgi:hypothetical protein
MKLMSFQEWMGERPQFAQAGAQQATQQGWSNKPVQKKWKATKDEIVQYWKALRPDMPIQITPIRYDHDGTTYAEDGVRITGSREFIGSVLARLKEFINFENAQTKLQLVYRETDSPSQVYTAKTSFVFYIQTKERGQGGVGIGASQKKPGL